MELTFPDEAKAGDLVQGFGQLWTVVSTEKGWDGKWVRVRDERGVVTDIEYWHLAIAG